METRLIIVRHGELALKGKNRSSFEDRLVSNIKCKLDGVGISSVRKLQGRVLIELTSPIEWKNIVDRIRYVFGFSNASPVHRTGMSMDDLEAAIVSEASQVEFSSFAVRAKRANKKFPIQSPKICKVIGAAIQEKTGARVDLGRPEKVFNIEVLDREIFFSHEKFKGPGGLPVGISGHVAVLLSGGIDSPVASWQMIKRGCEASFIHFHSKPFTDEASLEKVEEIAEEIGKWQNGFKLFLVPFGELQKKIVTAVPSKYRVVLYRRFMMRIASRLAEEAGALALVTGEALGQVASQTLSNIGSVEAASTLPVLRPLIGMDKQEIVDIAKKIGTFELSIQPHQDCCSFLQPPNPATKTSAKELDIVEKELDVDALVEEAVGGVERKV